MTPELANALQPGDMLPTGVEHRDPLGGWQMLYLSCVSTRMAKRRFQIRNKSGSFLYGIDYPTGEAALARLTVLLVPKAWKSGQITTSGRAGRYRVAPIKETTNAGT
jgi:hypothetical protein